jgi:hypothetical protein
MISPKRVAGPPDPLPMKMTDLIACIFSRIPLAIIARRYIIATMVYCISNLGALHISVTPSKPATLELSGTIINDSIFCPTSSHLRGWRLRLRK